jgi:hypothetical protein
MADCSKSIYQVTPKNCKKKRFFFKPSTCPKEKHMKNRPKFDFNKVAFGQFNVFALHFNQNGANCDQNNITLSKHLTVTLNCLGFYHNCFKYFTR